MSVVINLPEIVLDGWRAYSDRNTDTVVGVQDIARFITDHTEVRPVPFVPELVMHTGSEAISLWQRTEALTGTTNSAPPFWAFPWAGGQALARYVIDHPDAVRGQRVLDLASGGGLVALAAATAGAAAVTANDIDPYAEAAIALNAAANGLAVEPDLGDRLDRDSDVQVVLAGDVFYSRAMADRMLAFLRRAAAGGARVLVGDPGRAYGPTGTDVLATYAVPVLRDLEDVEVKRVTVVHIA